MRVPPVSCASGCTLAATKLAIKLVSTTVKIMRLARAGGIIIARNMPNSATLRALTMRSGKALPAMMPLAVPNAQPGMATAIAP